MSTVKVLDLLRALNETAQNDDPKAAARLHPGEVSTWTLTSRLTAASPRLDGLPHASVDHAQLSAIAGAASRRTRHGREDRTLNLAHCGDHLEIRDGAHATWTLPVIDAPPGRRVGACGPVLLELNREQLAHATTPAVCAARDADAPEVLTHVEWRETGGHLQALATDRHRLAVADLDDVPVPEGTRLHIPADVARALTHHTPPGAAVTVHQAGLANIRGGSIQGGGSVDLWIHLISTAPDWRHTVTTITADPVSIDISQVLASTLVHSWEVTVTRVALRRALDDVQAGVPGRRGPLRLHAVAPTPTQRGGLALDHSTPERSARAWIPAAGTPPPDPIHLDPGYLAAALDVITGPVLVIGGADPRHPLTVHGDERGRLYVLMPIAAGPARR